MAPLSGGSPTSTVYTWHGGFSGFPGFPLNFTVKISIELLSPTSLRLFTLFDEAGHFDVTLSRVVSPPIQPLPHHPSSWLSDGSHECVWNESLPGELARPWVSKALLSPPLAPPRGAQTEPRPGRACPFGAMTTRGGIGIMPVTNPSRSAPKAGGHVCYVVQPYVGLQLGWTIPKPGDTSITMTVSAPALETDIGSTGTWLGIGFGALWPTMQNMTVAAGVFPAIGAPRVASFFAAVPFGAPTLSATAMPLSNTSADRSGGRVSFSFTRDLANQFSPLHPVPRDANPYERRRSYFAMGQLDESGGLLNHGHGRGVFVVDLFHPDEVWDPTQRC